MTGTFWRPAHTVESVARRLAGELRDGSAVLDEPLAPDPDGLDVRLDVPATASDAEVLDVIKVLAQAADEGHRRGGGHGLSLRAVHWVGPAPDRPAGRRAVRVNLGPKDDADRPELIRDVLALLRQRSDLPLAADTGA